MTQIAPSMPATIATYRPSLRESISQAAGALAERAGAGRYARQDVEERVGNIADFVPGIGQLVQGNEIRRPLDRGAYGEAATEAALAALPFVGATFKGAKAIAKEGIALTRAPKNMASRSVNLYDPPVKPPRDFALDYPKGAAADATGRLRMDMDGRPLTGKYVSGRTHAGGSDTGLPAQAHDAIAAAAAGRLPETVARGQQIGKDAGRYVVLGDHRAIYRAKGLTPVQTERVTAHELGHMLDDMAGDIPADGIQRELDQVYNTLNTDRERTRNLTRPEHLGYRGENVRAEQVAEAIRAYMADPNYMKTVAPKTAARIRAYVNGHPKLKDIIQFNSVGAGLLGFGMLPQRLRTDAQEP